MLDDLPESVQKKLRAAERLLAVAEAFCDKVEKGQARSKDSYSKFLAAIKDYRDIDLDEAFRVEK